MVQYGYEILEVNKPANAMVVKYTADGYADYIIGTRMPIVGESLDAVVAQYAPLQQWLTPPVTLEYADVDVGANGVIDVPVAPVSDSFDVLADPEQQALAVAEMQKQAIRQIVIEVLNEQSGISTAA